MSSDDRHSKALTAASLAAALQEAPPRRLQISGFAEAAVLIPLIDRRGDLTLGFTKRPDEMPTHAGQISFPGGRREAADPDPVATALREAQEELGIDPDSLRVLGTMDDVPSPVGFVITPVVAWLDDPDPFEIDEREVDQYFEVKLARLRDPDVFRDRGEREIAGFTYPLPEYDVDGRIIWGATARMTQRLLEIIG